MKFSIVILSAAFIIFLSSGCSVNEDNGLEKPVGLFKQNELEEALPLFQHQISGRPDDAEAHAWLAETYRRLGRKQDAVESAVKALEIDTCSSFAHTVLASSINRLPEESESGRDTTWIHINKAVQCDSAYGVAWAYLCVEAMLRGKYDKMNYAAARLKETGFLTGAVLAYGKWMLRTLPDSAVIITNGDMDTYPMLALQAADGYRTDVAVVEKQWLGLKQYLSYLKDNYNLPLPIDDNTIDSMLESKPFPENMNTVSDTVFRKWLEMKDDGSFTKPIALAVTVYPDIFSDIKERFIYAGPFLMYTSDETKDSLDVNAIRNSIAAIRIKNFSGPWVSNDDYSPIRNIYTNRLAANITYMALEYSERLIEIDRLERAEKMIQWTEEFQDTVEMEPVYLERIDELKKRTYRKRK